MLNYNKKTGTIYDVQRFSLHDGPGIRTVVFFKGCPMRCKWCSNPESQFIKPEHMGQKKIGKVATVEDVLDIVERDSAFYEDSDGGMTLSGGEVLFQPEFALSLIQEAKKRGIHVAIETAAYQDWKKMEMIIKSVDTVMLDIKIMDSEKHKIYTGVSNDMILQNAKLIAQTITDLMVRYPVVPGINDDLDNMMATAQFCHENKINKIELLPYHRLGEYKYDKLGRQYELKEIRSPDKKELRQMANSMMQQYNVTVSSA